MRSLNIKYLPELDQLRGLAVLLVLLFHAVAGGAVVFHYLDATPAGVPIPHNLVELIAANGFTGVALFFVISGFLFTWGALQTAHFDWKKFYANRVLRIFPMYILILLAVFSLAQTPSFSHLIQSLAGFGNLTRNPDDFEIVLWTISVELQFYMIFPFLIGLLKRKGVRYILGLIAIMIALRLIARLDHISLHDPVYWTLFGRLDQFLIGMSLAWLVHQRGWLLPGRIAALSVRHLAALAAGLIALTGTMLAAFWLYTAAGWKFSEGYHQTIWPTIEGALWAGFGLCYVGLVQYFQPKALLVLQWLGIISYSAYLLHYPIVRALHQHPNLTIHLGDHRLLSGLATAVLEVLPLTIGLSVLTYFIIEKPPLDARKQYATFAPGSPKHPSPNPAGGDA